MCLITLNNEVSLYTDQWTDFITFGRVHIQEDKMNLKIIRKETNWKCHCATV